MDQQQTQRQQEQQQQQQEDDSIFSELYYYVIRDSGILVHDLQVHHVIRCLQDEGILFWRDGRFVPSQKVLLQRLLGVVTVDDQHDASTAHTASSNMQQEQQQQNHHHQLRNKEIEVLYLNYTQFIQMVRPCGQFFLQAFSEEFIIPDWSSFITDMTYHYYQVQSNIQGENAQYIPILQNANSNFWGLSICSIDGQRFSIGDTHIEHSLQSVSKPITYALGLMKIGQHQMEQWIDVEPAGRPFNTQDLDPITNRPFNASINSGAIMAAGVLASEYPNYTDWMDIMDHVVRPKWYEICGNDLSIGFSMDTFQSELSTAYNNFAIAYNLKGRRGLPGTIDVLHMLQVYLGCCSILITTEALSVAAATLANGGICPITGQEVFPAEVVRSVLSELMTCGMYDQSGAFAVQVGVPAKSGVSGALMVIVPNVMGYATFSPRLNSKGNSVRGIDFCQRFVSSYRIHMFEPLRGGSNTGAKINPRCNGLKEEQKILSRLAWATQIGDVYAIKLRDIFVFALLQTAIALPEGLSNRMIHEIQWTYQHLYQIPINEQFFHTMVENVQQNPTMNLQMLEKLIHEVYIVDSIRSIIITAMVDIILFDGTTNNEMSKTVGIHIATMLGIDATVAEMELNRLMGHHVGHRYKDVEYSTMMECIGGNINHHRRSSSELLNISRHSNSGGNATTTTSTTGGGSTNSTLFRRSLTELLVEETITQTNIIDVLDQSTMTAQQQEKKVQLTEDKQIHFTANIGNSSVLDNDGQEAEGGGVLGSTNTTNKSTISHSIEENQEVLFLRKEVLRLRRRVASLTTMLHERSSGVSIINQTNEQKEYY